MKGKEWGAPFNNKEFCVYAKSLKLQGLQMMFSCFSMIFGPLIFLAEQKIGRNLKTNSPTPST